MTQAVGLKADRGRLVVAGGVTGKVFTFNARTGRPLVTFDLSNGLPVGTGPGDFEGAKLFVNDVAVAPNGDLYVTDSIRPVLFRIPAAALRARPGTTIAIAPWLSLTGTPAAYTQALNLNGIEVSDNGRHLLTVHSLSGELFRVAIATGDIVKVDLGAGRIFGDGLLLRGRTLHSVTGFAGSAVDTVSLSADLDHGRIVSTTTAPTLDQPSTATFAGRDLLVVNFQVLRAVRAQPPNLPFTLTRIPAPTANDKHPHDIGGTR
jgi:Cu-Zn family superoxide dismutase